MKAVSRKHTANPNPKGNQQSFHKTGHSGYVDNNGRVLVNLDGSNKRSVWSVTAKPFSEAHFATYPPDLIIDCIKAGCPVNGVVLDPFMGAGTTALVAAKLNRNFIGFELNADYIKIANKRLKKELGMFHPDNTKIT
jgi:DNA modification methylase